jgi:hypothetical protein
LKSLDRNTNFALLELMKTRLLHDVHDEDDLEKTASPPISPQTGSTLPEKKKQVLSIAEFPYRPMVTQSGSSSQKKTSTTHMTTFYSRDTTSVKSETDLHVPLLNALTDKRKACETEPGHNFKRKRAVYKGKARATEPEHSPKRKLTIYKDVDYGIRGSDSEDEMNEWRGLGATCKYYLALFFYLTASVCVPSASYKSKT